MLRITAGAFKGRVLRTPAISKPGVRPTQSRLRAALFNSLQGYVENSQVLDLFAGSGALGFEALSRGASHVVFVESARSVVQLIEKNAQDLKVQSRVTIMGADFLAATKKLELLGPFDLAFADPPYSGGFEMQVLERLCWERLLSLGGRLCLEWGKVKSEVEELPENLPFLVKVREKTYGDSILTTYERT